MIFLFVLVCKFSNIISIREVIWTNWSKKIKKFDSCPIMTVYHVHVNDKMSL